MKQYLMLLIIVCILIPLVSVAQHTFPIQNINTGLYYTTIQSAIDAIETQTGHTIVISTGTFTENITVNKGLTIRGVTSNATIIQTNNPNTTVITITANNVQIKNLAVRNASGSGAVGIRLQNVGGVIIDSCCITNNFRGIQLQSSSNNIISNCEINSNIENGIVFSSSSKSNQIKRNTISNTTGNVGSWTGNGINIGDQSSSLAIIEDNTIYNNSNAGIIAYAGSNNMQIRNNTIYGNNGAAIQLGWSNGCVIENNNINNNFDGIIFDTAPNNTCRGNIIVNNTNQGIGLWGLGQTGIVIENNIINNNQEYGINFGATTCNCIVRFNTLRENKIGIKINNNPGYDNYGNRIYNNNFLENITQAIDESPGADYWDNGLPDGGNHWSNWIAPDENKDRIVDIPYQIMGSYSQDNYPYVFKNGWDATIADLTITTTTLCDAIAGNVYSDTLKATGGMPPFQWSIIEGILPQGLYFNANEGIISGVPTKVGTFIIKVRVTDSYMQIDEKQLSIKVVPSGLFSSQLMINEGYNPDIAMNYNTSEIYITYRGFIGLSGGTGIVCNKSIDGGNSFGTAVRISPGSNGDGGDYPSIAIDNRGYIHVAYIRPSYHIYYSRSIDGGASFSSPIKINDVVASSLAQPKVAVFGETVYVVWHSDDNKIFLDKSNDGLTFGTDVQVSNSGGVHVAPSIAIDENGKIHITWQGRWSMQWQIWYAQSTDNGQTFSANLRVDDSQTHDVRTPAIAVRSQLVAICWSDYRDVYPDIRCAKSDNGGATFGNSVKVNDNTNDTDQKLARISINDSGLINIVWQDGRNDDNTPDIYFAKSQGNSLSFSKNIKTNSAAGKSNYGHRKPSIAVCANTVWICWQGTEPSSSWNVYFAKASFDNIITSVEEKKIPILPAGFVLHQNYPNPFNPSTVIRYSLPVNGLVTLKVYDILGKEVATLVNETKEAGSYEVRFDASCLASGIYLYKLQAGHFSVVKKLVLMK